MLKTTPAVIVRTCFMIGSATLLGVSARADTIFSSFGTGQSYLTTGGLSISTIASANHYEQEEAIGFTPLSTYILTAINIPLGYVSGTDSFVVQLKTDNNGPTGPLVATWNVTAPVFLGPDVNILSPGGTVTLSAGALYWLVVLPGGADSWGAWNEPPLSSSTFSYLATSNDGGLDWYPPVYGQDDLAVSVMGTAIPEPRFRLLVGVGILLILVYGSSLRARPDA